MKKKWNEYTIISAYAFAVICLSLIFSNLLSNYTLVLDKVSMLITTLQPLIIGATIAYLLNFILKFYENNLNKIEFYLNLNKKLKRTISIVLTYLSAISLLYLLMSVVVPQIADSLVTLVNNSPEYLSNLTTFLEDNFNSLNISHDKLLITQERINEIASHILSMFTGLIPVAGNIVISIASSIWNIVLGIIISIYLLIDKERFRIGAKKVILAILPIKMANKIFYITQKGHITFSKFLSGKIIDSVIIGILTAITLALAKIPYTALISVIIGITNIIPFFGPFIGAIPSILLLLVVSPSKAILFTVIIIIIQQIDGNIIGPKILGDSIGISAFWILFSLLVAGKVFGIVGMVIGVPLFATIYSLITEEVENTLKNKNIDNLDDEDQLDSLSI